jgi:hypothetical protein
MTQRDGSRNLVDVLPARATGARKAFFQIDLANAKAAHSLLQLIHLVKE